MLLNHLLECLYLYRKHSKLMKEFFSFFKSKQFLINLGLIIVVVVSVMWGILKWLDGYTNHGEQIAVPNIVGLHQDELEGFLSKRELRFEIIDEVFSTEHPKGTVIRQDPIAHSEETESYVKSNRKIYVTVVSGEDRMIVFPDLSGRSKRLAQAQLDIVGIKPIYKPIPYEFNDVVVKQQYKGEEIKAGDKIPFGASVTIYIGVGQDGEPIPVPNLIGQTADTISTYLSDKPIYPYFEYENCETKEDSLMARAYKQHPPASKNESQFKKPGFTLTIFMDKNFKLDTILPIDSLNNFNDSLIQP